jgi:hypothetical protein
VVSEPLAPTRAKQLIAQIMASGRTVYSRHAQEEMENDDLISNDVVNVLRGGVVDQPEMAGGSWRYRVRTHRIVVVVAFASDAELRVVTAWRIKA